MVLLRYLPLVVFVLSQRGRSVVRGVCTDGGVVMGGWDGVYRLGVEYAGGIWDVGVEI